MRFLLKNSIISKEEDLIMPRKSKQHDKQFKLDAVQYVNEHPDLTQTECAKNLGISIPTLTRWLSQYREHEGDIPSIIYRKNFYSSDLLRNIS